MKPNSQLADLTSRIASLADTVGFELLGENLAGEVESSLQTALAGGAIFYNTADPLSIFREGLAACIRSIDSHPRGELFQEFLLKGPYEDAGPIPSELVGQRLSDEATTSVIAFIYSYMVNSFKGAVTEMLGSAACIRLLGLLQRNGVLPLNTRLFVGDAVLVRHACGEGWGKGADLHILVKDPQRGPASVVNVVGVGEVKSYFPSERRLCEQLDHHLRRAKRGVRVTGVDYPGESVTVGYGKGRCVTRIAILPSDWKLPRSFRFEDSENGRLLHVDPSVPPRKDDQITKTADNEWMIILRWSKEALAAAAYEMTFWYMEKVGEVVYSQRLPKEWGQMNPAQAGRNAAKMMLYYAILRCRTTRESQRAIALYNCYGFGYALGMNFRNTEGKREMLWPQDLDEILSAGQTKCGCRIY